MATLIKETPVLRGEDARRFIKQMKENENRRISKEELAIMRDDYEKLKAIAKFDTEI